MLGCKMSRRSRKANASSASRQQLESPTRLSLIRMLGLGDKSVIDLSNMVRYIQKLILRRMQEPVRSRCQTIFHEFIFEHKSLQLPVETFMKKLEQHSPAKCYPKNKPLKGKRKASLRETGLAWNSESVGKSKLHGLRPHSRTELSVSKPALKTQEQVVQDTLQQLSFERNFIRCGTELIQEIKPSDVPAPKPPVRSKTPLPAKAQSVTCPVPTTTSYSKLNKTRETRRQRRPSAPRPRRSVQSTGKTGSLSSSVWISGSTDFKDTYSDVDALLRIRQAHLRYC